MWTFHPIYKHKIWGGSRIAALKGLAAFTENIGESWEISVLPGSVSMVRSTVDHDLSLNDLVKKYREALLGNAVYEKHGLSFPLLIKFIDASADLSVQVHPDDAMAIEEGLPSGKSELSFILESAPGARFATGFVHPVEAARYEGLVETGDIERCMRFTDTAPGMAFFVPAGRIHAIGAGNLICEIQDSCDTTYRLYDYQRRDADGNLRELHTDKAFRALDFNDTDHGTILPKEISKGIYSLLRHPHFNVNLLTVRETAGRDYSRLDSFVILVMIKGSARLMTSGGADCPGEKSLTVREGETILIPAAAKELRIEPETESMFLETAIGSAL